MIVPLGRFYSGTQYGQFLLALCISIPAAWLPELFASFIAPDLRQGGALPAFTEAWLHGYRWAWWLPALVLLIRALKLGLPRSGTSALALACVGGLSVNAVAVIVAWMSVMAVPGMV